VGLLALVFFGFAVWVSYARSTRVRSASVSFAAYGLGLGLLAILVHSLSDFGQHLPANALLTAIFCALLIVLGREAWADTDRAAARDEGHAAHPSSHRASLSACPALAWRMVALCVVVGVWVWAIGGAERARQAESHWQEVLAAERQLEADQWVARQGDYQRLFTPAVAAVVAEPGNIEYRHWLGAYKWLSLAPYTDPNTQQLAAEALPWARQIADELLEARAVCPTFGASYCLAGEIEKFVLGDPNGADHIRTGYRLAPCDATACFAAARIDAEEGQVDDAFAKLARTVQLDGRFFSQAVHLCIRDLGREDLAVQLAQEDPDRLASVANTLVVSDGAEPQSVTTPGSAGTGHPFAELAQTKAFDQLKKKCEEPGTPAYAHASLANLYRRRGEMDAAMQHYRQALMKEYDQVEWHYALAQLLAGQGRTDEAVHEARICLRFRPDYAAAKSLVEQLSLLRAGTQ